MPATLSLNAIRERCVKFAYDWSDCVGDEKQDGHEFMRELMKCFGITKRKAISYERRSNRASTGRQGYIDALIPGKALIEMKSAGKDLNKAEEQALDYIHDLADVETPPSSPPSFVSTETTPACGNATCSPNSWIPGPVRTAAKSARSSHSSIRH